jgi:hypothetical protein
MHPMNCILKDRRQREQGIIVHEWFVGQPKMTSKLSYCRTKETLRVETSSSEQAGNKNI